MRIPPLQIATAALAFLGGSMVFLAPAHATSRVEPVHTFDFVIDNGACDFPVEWSGSTRALGIDTNHGFITMSPTWTVTMTNTETGKSWSPAGNGAITYNDLDDGSFQISANGVNSSPGDALLFKGSWTKTFYPDGTDSGWVGTGQLIDICEQLA